MKRMIPLIIHAYGSEKNGELDEESKMRCREAVDAFLYSIKANWNRIILVGAREPNSETTLAESMKKYLERWIDGNKIIAKGIAQNTEAEIKVAFEIIKEQEPEVVGVVSAWYQFIRVWWSSHGKGVKVHYFLSPSAVGLGNFWSIIKEPVKIAALFLGLKKPKVAGAV